MDKVSVGAKLIILMNLDNTRIKEYRNRAKRKIDIAKVFDEKRKSANVSKMYPNSKKRCIFKGLK